MGNLDLKDRKILYELDRNARQSNAQIAKKVKLSPEVVFHRIKKLERVGIIDYYYTTIDPSKFGYKAYRVYVKTQDLTIEKEKEIIDWLVKNKKTWWVLTVEGKYNLDFFFWVKDDYEFEEEWLNFCKRFRAHIQSKLIQIYTNLYHFHRPYLIGKSRDEEPQEVIFSREKVSVDKIDLKIMKAMATNARISLVDLSKIVGISPKNIAYRIKNLKRKKVILSFRAKINLKKLDYEYYKIEINLNDYSRIKEMYTFARFHPNITYINRVIGLADFDADVEVPNEQDLVKVFVEFRKMFGNTIRDFEYLTIRNVHKISYIPDV